jgi:hypothetical protein
MLSRVWPLAALLLACDLGENGATVDGGPPTGEDAAPSADAGPRPDASTAVFYRVNLKTLGTNQFLSATEGGGQGVTADRATAAGWETFVLVDLVGGELESGDRVAVRAENGRYLGVDGSALHAAGDAIDETTTFRLERRDGDGVIADRDDIGFVHLTSGGWLTAVGGGGAGTDVSGASFGDAQTFELQLRNPPPPPPLDWELVWQDEFDGPEIDESKWSYEDKGPGWVNNELQNYVPRRKENARIEDGKLVIEGRRDNFEGHEYSSARLHTHGKASWKFGRFVARLQVPAGRGTWPAFWMMPDDSSRGWPACGEIDVMEHVGYEPNVVHSTTHSLKFNWMADEQRTAWVPVAGATSGFHEYAIEWRPGRIDAYVDGQHYFASFDDGSGDDAWPFNKNFYLILNLAIGGNWGGAMGVDPNVWPQRYVIDWVRVYQAR